MMPIPHTLPARQRKIDLGSLALPWLFFQFGLVCSSWASRIPAVCDHLQLTPSSLSLALLCGGLGAVGSFPVSARLMARQGGARTSLYAGFALLITLPCLALAPGILSLMLFMLSFGLACGCFDVGVNSVSAHAEKIAGRSLMSMLHAWFCVGALGGALLGSAMASMTITPTQHFLLLSALLALPLRFACQSLPTEVQPRPHAKKSFELPQGRLLSLGLIGFFGAMSEGSISDWSGIFMKDHFGAADGAAPIALTAFSLMMLCMRLCGDSIKKPFGARRLIVAGALLSAAGLLLSTLAGNAALAVGGFGLAGAGLALVFPYVFSAAGRLGPSALAQVATMSYSGSLLGPPIAGAAAELFGLAATIGLLALLSFGIALAASRTRLLD